MHGRTVDAGTPAEHHVDPETLRAVPHRPGELAALLDAGGDDTTLGTAAYLLGRPERTEHHLRRALDGAEPGVAAWRARLHLGAALRHAGRLPDAATEFARCAEGIDGLDGVTVSFLHQHLGTLHYDRGDWAAAGDCFATAVRLRAGAPAELRAGSRLAALSAHACLTARTAATEVDRLVPAMHKLAATTGGAELRYDHGAPPEAGMLTELRRLLGAGPVPAAVVRGIYRYYDQLDTSLDVLLDTGWLARDGDTLQASAAAAGLVADLAAHVDATAAAAWPEPPAGLDATITALLDGAAGTSEGPVFDAMVAAGRAVTGPAGLFDRVNALRYHRADAHATAWAAAGLDAAGARALADGDPLRRRIETATDLVNARAYRPLAPADRQSLVDGLRALPS